MKFEVYYLIQPTELLRELARRAATELSDLLVETSMFRAEEGHPTFPLDGFDHELYVKVLYMQALAAEYAGDQEFEGFWSGRPPATVADFDKYWSLQRLGCENLAALEAQIADAPETSASSVSTGNAAVDRALRRLRDG